MSSLRLLTFVDKVVDICQQPRAAHQLKRECPLPQGLEADGHGREKDGGRTKGRGTDEGTGDGKGGMTIHSPPREKWPRGGQENTTWRTADGFNQNENCIALMLQPKTKRNISINFTVTHS